LIFKPSTTSGFESPEGFAKLWHAFLGGSLADDLRVARGGGWGGIDFVQGAVRGMSWEGGEG